MDPRTTLQMKVGGEIFRIPAIASRNTADDTAPTISSDGSDKQRLVAVQIGPDGIEWCHYEPSTS